MAEIIHIPASVQRPTPPEPEDDPIITLLLAIELIGKTTLLKLLSDADVYTTDQQRAWIHGIERCRRQS